MFAYIVLGLDQRLLVHLPHYVLYFYCPHSCDGSTPMDAKALKSLLVALFYLCCTFSPWALFSKALF